MRWLPGSFRILIGGAILLAALLVLWVNIPQTLPVLLGGAILLVAVLLLWLGINLLLLPLRLIWSLGKSLAIRVDPLGVVLLLAWTIALAPTPFIDFWRWLVQCSQAVLVDAPQQALPALTTALNTCFVQPSNCVLPLSFVAKNIWATAIAQPLRTFEVPSQIDRAAILFAIGATVVCVFTRTTTSAGPDARSDLRAVAALTASFLFALYLAIVSIIATPVLGERVVNLETSRGRLTDQLKAAIPSSGMQYPDDDLTNERNKLQEIQTVLSSVKAPQSANLLRGAALRLFGFQESFLRIVETVWTSQLEIWDESAARLRRDAADLPKEAQTFVLTAQTFFQVSNEGHIGEAVTQRHAITIADSFNLWILDYKAAVEACTATLRDNLGKFRSYQAKIGPAINLALTGDGATSSANQTFPTLDTQPCQNIKPIVRSYLPSRSGPDETLGIFGAAAAWLLRTESQELGLIIGLLGFGFFGALAASFVREFANTEGNKLPSMDFIVPALIRGVGAAILVFLLAKGGMAIFTRGGDATPNAYAVFFACFVAAVFSEDVWSWARTRQRNQLAGGEAGERSGKTVPTVDTHAGP